jgi:hypothetical protein
VGAVAKLTVELAKQLLSVLHAEFGVGATTAGDSRGMWRCLDYVGRALDPNKLIAFNKLVGNF